MRVKLLNRGYLFTCKHREWRGEIDEARETKTWLPVEKMEKRMFSAKGINPRVRKRFDTSWLFLFHASGQSMVRSGLTVVLIWRKWARIDGWGGGISDGRMIGGRIWKLSNVITLAWLNQSRYFCTKFAAMNSLRWSWILVMELTESSKNKWKFEVGNIYLLHPEIGQW